MAKGWYGEPMRHSLAAKGVRTKMMRSKMMEGNIYQKINILSTDSMDGNYAINSAMAENPELWDQDHPFRANAYTLVALKESAVGDMYPGLRPENIIGFIRYIPRFSEVTGEEIGIELSYLEVRKDWQRKGIGYALLGYFMDETIGYDNRVFIAYGSEEGKAFWDKFYKDPQVREELWERDIKIALDE